MTWPIHLEFPDGTVLHLEVKPGEVVQLGRGVLLGIRKDPNLAAQDREKIKAWLKPTPPPKTVEFVVHIKAPPPPPPVDEFEAEARRLLKDDGTRSWEDVERDVAAALRARAGGNHG